MPFSQYVTLYDDDSISSIAIHRDKPCCSFLFDSYFLKCTTDRCHFSKKLLSHTVHSVLVLLYDTRLLSSVVTYSRLGVRNTHGPQQFRAWLMGCVVFLT